MLFVYMPVGRKRVPGGDAGTAPNKQYSEDSCWKPRRDRHETVLTADSRWDPAAFCEDGVEGGVALQIGDRKRVDYRGQIDTQW